MIAIRHMSKMALVGVVTAIVLIAAPSTAWPAASNGKLVFASDRDGDLELYTMDGDGTSQTRLTSWAGDDTNPAWSPSGTQIAFASTRNGSFDLFRMQAAGGSATQLSTGPDSDLQPTWSPGGTRLAFVSDRSGSLQIHAGGTTGTGSITQLTDTSGFNVDPVWSANGKIVFTSSRDGNEEIYVMDADGGNPTRLTNDPGRDFGPYWSPDGTRIAFVSERDGNSEIYAMDANGAALQRLTNEPSLDSGPAWSPDGSKIAFHSDRDSQLEIYTMAADGSAQTRLTSNRAADRLPDWQPIPLGGADTEPPSVNVPADIFVDATSPAGATVTFNVTATDAVDPGPLVSCSPASGSRFPIGATGVTCTATDRAGNSSADSFVVRVRSAAQQLASLVDSVGTAAGLPQALRIRLQILALSFRPPQTPLQRQFVCLQLTRFIEAVRSPLANRIPAAQRNAWIADARRLRAVLGC